jgi:hypothetical protein
MKVTLPSPLTSWPESSQRRPLSPAMQLAMTVRAYRRLVCWRVSSAIREQAAERELTATGLDEGLR